MFFSTPPGNDSFATTKLSTAWCAPATATATPRHRANTVCPGRHPLGARDQPKSRHSNWHDGSVAVWDRDRDAVLRVAAIDYMQRRSDAAGGFVTRTELEAFKFLGEQVKLIDQSRGIRNPAQLPATLSVLTNPSSGYDDEVGSDGLLRYSIRSGEWAQGDNRKLLAAFELSVPLIWLQTIGPARFVVAAPVYLVAADPSSGQYSVAITQELRSSFNSSTPLEVAYVDRITRERLHQPMFRARVMDAYRVRCAIHHAAFDSNIIGIRPDYVVQVSASLLDEKDGPMLQDGLQAFHGRTLRQIPSRTIDRPSTQRLEERYAEFLAAS